MYLLKDKVGRGLRSVEQKYKITKIKTAVKLYQKSDPFMKAVYIFFQNKRLRKDVHH